MLAQNGLVQLSSRYSVDETISRLQSAFAEKGLKFRGDRSQRRSGKSRTEDACDEGDRVWQSEGRNSADGSFSDSCD